MTLLTPVGQNEQAQRTLVLFWESSYLGHRIEFIKTNLDWHFRICSFASQRHRRNASADWLTSKSSPKLKMQRILGILLKHLLELKESAIPLADILTNWGYCFGCDPIFPNIKKARLQRKNKTSCFSFLSDHFRKTWKLCRRWRIETAGTAHQRDELQTLNKGLL